MNRHYSEKNNMKSEELNELNLEYQHRQPNSVKEKDTLWFVQFCVPWCKHCKKIDSLWDEFGKAVEGEDSVEIAQVDCSTSKPVCSKVDIHSYPTFKLFYNGEEYEKYTGPRDVESLKAYVEDKAEKLARGELENEQALL